MKQAGPVRIVPSAGPAPWGKSVQRGQVAILIVLQSDQPRLRALTPKCKAGTIADRLARTSARRHGEGPKRVALERAADLPEAGQGRWPVVSMGAGISMAEYIAAEGGGPVTKGKARILVADDQPFLVETCAEILVEAGYSVDTACDGRAALDQLAAEPFDLLLADLKIPGLDGLAILRRARELYPGLAAVMTSSGATLENAIEVMRAGAQDLLLKPFDPDDLLCSVREALAAAGRGGTVQALRHKEQQLRSIYDNVSDVLFYLAVEPEEGFRFVSVNRVFVEVTGLAEEQVIGKDYRQVIPEPAHELVLGKYREAIRERRTVTWEEVSVYPAGKKYGEVSVAPVFDADGRCTHLVGTVHDVTEQRAAHAKVRASEEKYRALFENSLEAILLSSSDGSIQAANPAACRMLKRTEAEILQAGLPGVVDTSDPNFAELLAERDRTGTARGELTMLRRDGTPFPAEISTAVLQDGDDAGRTSMMLRDITGRKRAKEEIERHARELATLLEVSQTLTATLDLDVVIRTFIDGAMDLLNLGTGAIYLLEGETLVLRAATPPLPSQFPEELRRAPLADHPNIRRAITSGWPVFLPDTDTADLTPAERAASEFRGLRSVVYVPLLSTGQVVGVWILASVGERRAFSEAEIDLSRTLAAQAAAALANARLFERVRASGERLRALARHLQDAQEKERARVARELHDEFGQALTVLKIDLSRLVARLPEGDEVLGQQAQAMMALIDQTVDAVRNVATRLRPGLLDRLGLAAAIEWQAEEVAGRTGLQVDLDLRGGGRELDPDLATAVFRIFQEALTNAVRHAGASRVQVVLRAEDEILLRVQDNGRGITSGQVGGSRSWGLAGMRERALAWAGVVELEGTPGQGTTLTLRLPWKSRQDVSP